MSTEKSDIGVVLGRCFDITLQGQSGTGFTWCLSGISNCLALVGKQVVAIHPGLPGGAVREIFTFAGIEADHGELHFRLIRPWKPLDVADSKQFQVDVVVVSVSEPDELEESMGSNRFVSGTGKMNHTHPNIPYGFPRTIADEQGIAKVFPLYGYPPVTEYGFPMPYYGFPECKSPNQGQPNVFPDCQSGATAPGVIHTSDPSKCVVMYGFPGGVAMNPSDCHLKYGFPVHDENVLNSVILKYGFPGPVVKYGFPDAVVEDKNNCVVKYGTPGGISKDAKNCTMKYGFPVVKYGTPPIVKYGAPNCKE